MATHQLSDIEGPSAWITLATNSVGLVNWSEAHDLSSCEHAVISFDKDTQNSVRSADRAVSYIKYDWSKTNWNEFRNSLRDQVGTRMTDLESPHVETSTVALTNVLKATCEASMGKAKIIRQKPPPWWNQKLDGELTALRRWKIRLRNSKNAFRKRAVSNSYA